jgi:DNA/RNA endonuclease YhcR with UshA esterase domain
MRTLFEINDNTGTFKVIFYQKGEHEVPTALKNFTYEEKMYVKVYGTIRVFKEEKAIVGTHIKKVEKFDEVTNHML